MCGAAGPQLRLLGRDGVSAPSGPAAKMQDIAELITHIHAWLFRYFGPSRCS
jgi:hypothetical protein